MWLLTPFGFFSIVRKPDDKNAGTLTVRARVRSDLETLKEKYLPELGPITVSDNTDYRFRAKAKQSSVAAAMVEFVGELDYSNFKNEVAARQGSKWAGLYHDVWDVLYRLQKEVAFEGSGKKKPVPRSAETASQAYPEADSQILKADSYGGVLVNAAGDVLLREPKGHFGGYVWTFAKGRPDKGEPPIETALREVREETGYHAEVLAPIPEVFGGSTSTTAFFLMTAIGPQGQFHEETASTRWVSFDEANELLKQTKIKVGRERDLSVLKAAKAVLDALDEEMKKAP